MNNELKTSEEREKDAFQQGLGLGFWVGGVHFEYTLNRISGPHEQKYFIQ